jgi:hypothetical protein
MPSIAASSRCVASHHSFFTCSIDALAPLLSDRPISRASSPPSASRPAFADISNTATLLALVPDRDELISSSRDSDLQTALLDVRRATVLSLSRKAARRPAQCNVT